jgi:diaminopimelate epimerase
MAAPSLSEPTLEIATGRFEKAVQFSKYTSFGNTFIIVDETEQPLDSDAHRAAFARWALNKDFGIGGTDNVLYLRTADGVDLPADGRPADVVFRIFEYDGAETLSCGNGLLSTAAFLHRLTGRHQWGVLTELPSGRPKLVQVGIGDTPGRTWVEAGWPRPTSTELYRRSGPEPQSAIDEVPPLRVPLPQGEEWAAGLPAQVSLSGLLTYTGEPHLVLFEGSGFPAEMASRIWVEPPAAGGGWLGLPEPPSLAASCQLVHHLGSYVDRHYRDLFPQGVHLNFARVREPDVVEYRTWERAINRETLACGSGAVAMAHIGRAYGLIEGTAFTFWPHRCRWYLSDASLRVHESDTGLQLSGSPRLVCEGMAPKLPKEV